MKVIKLKKTCPACPAQWEGILEDGRMVYIRYRFGHLTARISEKPTADVMDAVGGDFIFSWNGGHDLDGTMTFLNMANLLKKTLEFSEEVVKQNASDLED